MKADDIKIEPEALKALIRANLAGPNCERDEKALLKLYQVESQLSLLEISRYFDQVCGPIGALVSYCCVNKIKIVSSRDIAKMYCIDHIGMVKNSEWRFSLKDDDYFDKLSKNGFQLHRKNLLRYLFSCIGKVGIVEKVGNGFCKVRCYVNGKEIIAVNIFSPMSVKRGDKVAIHFASIMAVIDDETFNQIKKYQVSPWYDRFKSVKMIGYAKWLKGNLAEFTRSQFKLP